MCGGDDFTEWWKEASDIEKINWMIRDKIVAFCGRDDKLVGVKLYPVTMITKKRKWVRAMTEDGEAYFKLEYFKPVVNFCKELEWFLTEKRMNKKHSHEYRLLVGKSEDEKYVLIAPVKPDPLIREAFEK